MRLADKGNMLSFLCAASTVHACRPRFPHLHTTCKHQVHPSPTNDLMVASPGRHVCAEYQEAYNEYRKQLMERYRAQAEELKAQVRGH